MIIYILNILNFISFQRSIDSSHKIIIIDIKFKKITISHLN